MYKMKNKPNADLNIFTHIKNAIGMLKIYFITYFQHICLKIHIQLILK